MLTHLHNNYYVELFFHVPFLYIYNKVNVETIMASCVQNRFFIIYITAHNTHKPAQVAHS